jgi:hypothetical protein
VRYRRQPNCRQPYLQPEIDLRSALIFIKIGAEVWSTIFVRGSKYFFMNSHIFNERKEKAFKKLYSQSGRVLKILDNSLSYIALHQKFKRATPKLFALYQTSVNLFNGKNNNPFPITDQLNQITLTDRRNLRLTFVRQNRFRVGLNCMENRMRSLNNVIDKKWLELSFENYKLSCKIRIIQHSLESM